MNTLTHSRETVHRQIQNNAEDLSTQLKLFVGSANIYNGEERTPLKERPKPSTSNAS
jgi:hypothetical protein